jgi:hypothetical protein
MSAHRKNHPEIVRMAIAALAAMMSIAALALLDFGPNHSQGSADGMITSAVLTRAGAVATPSEKPTDIAAPETVVASGTARHRWFFFD